MEKLPVQSRSWRIFATCLGVIVVGGVAVWGGILCYDLTRDPVINAQRHDYAVALANVLDLQALALREAQRGERSYFAAHIGCGAPDVWQNPKVLANFKAMIKAGVEINLLAGLSGGNGQLHPKGMVKWLDELEEKLKTAGLDPRGFVRLPQELPAHSLVAGSARHARGYITSPEPEDHYPAVCFMVRDKELIEQWRAYLLSKSRASSK
jgi:hypothetical protein